MNEFFRDNAHINPVLGWNHGDIEAVAYYPNLDKPRRNTTRADTGPIQVKDIGDLTACTKFGASGFNVDAKRSEWGGWDFDGLNHGNGQTVDTLDAIIEALKLVPWVQIQRSKSGEGFHLLWRWANFLRAMTRGQHKDNCRRVLLLLSQLTGIDLASEGDCGGAILFLYTTERNPKSFEVLQTAEGYVPDELPELPAPKPIPTTNSVELSEFDEDHHEIVDAWSQSGFAVRVQQDSKGKPCLLLHVKACESGPDKTFRTSSPGTDPRTPNGYARPLPNGGFLIGKFGGDEPAPWFKSASGNTVCLYNVNDVATKAGICLRSYNGSFIGTVDQIAYVLPIEVGPFAGRPATLKRDDRQWVVSVDSKKSEELPDGWTKVGYKALAFADAVESKRESKQLYIVRERQTSQGQDVGDWMAMERDVPTYFKTDAKIKAELKRLGYGRSDIEEMMASATPLYKRVAHLRPSIIEGQYLNVGGARLRVTPAPGPHPTWDAIEERIGSLLSPYVISNEWCQRHSITTGGQYLRLIRAVMFQHPDHPTPYLALYSRQGGTGKTLYVETIPSILVEGGVAGGAKFLSGQGSFNGHLATSWFAFIAEVDISAKGAYDRLKAYVTDELVESEAKHQNATVERNHCHLVQLCNKLAFIPLEAEDRRIVIVPVPSLSPSVQGDESLTFHERLANGKWIHGIELKERLTAEAPGYLHSLLNMELPLKDNALWVPIISTKERDTLIEVRTDPVRLFVDRQMMSIENAKTPFKEFFERFNEWHLSTLGTELGSSDLRSALRKMDDLELVMDRHGAIIKHKTWGSNV